MARIQYNGTSELLLKPLGQMDQGGGKVLDASDATYADLQEFVSRVNNPPSCQVTAPTAAVASAQQLDPEASLRRLTVQLTGALPLLTANYTVVNPWSARIYGVSPAFNNASDPNEFVTAQVSIARNGQQLALPHAGVLTMPTFLNRFPTTVTNRNRHRARWVLDMFLATDILTFGTRPIDATAGSNYANPTRDNPQCNVCHKVIDPIAGDFQKWDDNVHAEQWLAGQMVQDARFGTAMLNILYQGFLGQAPLTYPTDPTQVSFASDQAAWHLQDALYKQYIQDFVASNYNLKTLVVDLLAGPLYRTVNIDGFKDPKSGGPLDPREIQAVLHMGTFDLLTPEVLNNKITALTGVSWGGAQNPLLLNDYRILYGGIDSEAVTVRLSAPNGLMANLALGMANQVSCQAVPADFALAASARRFFPNVEMSYTPQTSDGADIPEHIALIQKNIAYLHQYLLGEDNADEVAYTYTLFEQIWREGFDDSGTRNTWSGQNDGYPALGAVIASTFGASQPLAFISSGATIPPSIWWLSLACRVRKTSGASRDPTFRTTKTRTHFISCPQR